MSRESYYAKHTVELRRELARAIPRETLLDLHQLSPLRHFLVLAWQYFLLAAAGTTAVLVDSWYIWVPCSIVIGFTIFNFTVMLHEVVHEAVAPRRRDKLNRFLGYLYALPSGISRAQFTRWHLDHHAQLGDAVGDPKRHHLSPKKHKRWYKALYCTPALFFIYFRAARLETANYDEDLQREVGIERRITIFLHLAILAGLLWVSPSIALKLYIVPIFCVFPAAFMLNRLGQHYDIDPSDPAKWSTLVAPSRFWDIAFLWSNYHLEHHYFPRVPFYKLRRLHFALRPFYQERGLVPVTYSRLLWNWFVLNKTPHTKWSSADSPGPQTSTSAG